MMEVEDDTPLTAETQSDEEQAIAQPYQNEQLPIRMGCKLLRREARARRQIVNA